MFTENTAIIHGTLRPADLIPAFIYALRGVEDVSEFEREIPDAVFFDDSHDWWNTDDAYHLAEDLIRALNRHSPKGCYFGPHPGDGSDFGFWTIED